MCNLVNYIGCVILCIQHSCTLNGRYIYVAHDNIATNYLTQTTQTVLQIWILKENLQDYRMTEETGNKQAYITH